MSVVRAGFAPALVILLCAPTLSRAGVVRGQITVPADRGETPGEGLWRIDNGVLPVTPRVIDPRTECVVMLVPRAEAKAKEAKEKDGKDKVETVTVELRGLRLAQTAIAVPVGAQLDLKNEDRVPHTMYTAAPDETVVPLRPTPAGAVRSERMRRPGTFLLLDDELPHVRGWLIVTDGGIALHPDEHGAFSGQIPDGRYSLRVFFRGAYVVERELDVNSRTVELQLTLPGRAPRKEPGPEPPARPAPAPAPVTTSPDAGSGR